MRMFETEEAQESMSTPAPAGVAGTAPDAQSEGAGSEGAISAGPASIPSEVAPGSAPPPEVLAAAAATGAIDAGPAPSAPPTTGPPPFLGAAPSLPAVGEEPAPVAPGDQAAGPAPGVAYEGTSLTVEEGEGRAGAAADSEWAMRWAPARTAATHDAPACGSWAGRRAGHSGNGRHRGSTRSAGSFS